MFSPSLSAEEQREMAEKITSFLSLYTNISDSYIIVRLTVLPFSTRYIHVQPSISYFSTIFGHIL